jgi:hypothetical protein
MGDDSIDMVISHINMGHLVTLQVALEKGTIERAPAADVVAAARRRRRRAEHQGLIIVRNPP